MVYDWRITLKKGLKSAAMVFLTGFLAWQWNNPWVLAFMPLAEMGLNWIKNQNLEQKITYINKNINYYYD